MIQLTIRKNGGDTHSIATTCPAYQGVQTALAKAVGDHIAANPVEQEIEEVTIRWKAPIEREYSYKVEPLR